MLLSPAQNSSFLTNRLSKEDLDKVLKDSYRTLVTLKAKGKKVVDDDEEEGKKENLRKKYAKFTQILT
jgi:hypothetical protein